MWPPLPDPDIPSRETGKSGISHHFSSEFTVDEFQISEFNFTGLHSKLSPDTHFLIIHGELDQIVPFSYAQGFLDLIPWARLVPIGDTPASIPHGRFGHSWIEYFTAELWYEVIEAFLESNGPAKARL
jgi:hypothetical protein